MIAKDSRYLLTEVVQVTSPSTGELSRPAFLAPRSRVTSVGDDDRFALIPEAKRWGNVGRDSLGSASHWWVVADMSRVVDPFTQLHDREVRIPSQTRFYFDIIVPERFR